MDINKNHLTLLTEEHREPEKTKQILREAVKGNVTLYFLHCEESVFKPLLPGQIEEIRQSYPNRVEVVLKKAQYNSVGSRKFLEALPDTQYIGAEDIWVNKKKVLQFAHGEKTHGEKIISKDKETLEKLNNYSTSTLHYQRETIKEFWLDYDPERPPKKDDIIPWIMKQFGLSEAKADEIDRAVRPDKYRPGGNKPFKNKSESK